MSFFTEEELKKLKVEQRLKKHPLPWSAEYKSPKWKGRRSLDDYGPPSFYLIKDADNKGFMQVDDPQEAYELLKLVNKDI